MMTFSKWVRSGIFVASLIALVGVAKPAFGDSITPPPNGSADSSSTSVMTSTIPPGTTAKIAEDVPLASAPPSALTLSPQSIFNITLSVPAYSQTDSRWSGQVMQWQGHTIGAAGCLLTSATMVFRYYGASKDPSGMNSCMGSSADPWLFAPGANCSDSKANYNNVYGFSYNTLVTEITNNVPSILELTKPGPNNTTLTHWVVISRLYGDGMSDSNYQITDPQGGVVRELTYYTQSGWSKNRIAVYTKR